MFKNTDVFNGNVIDSGIDKDVLSGLNMGYSSDGQMTSGYSNAIDKLASSYKEATADANALKMAQDGLSESTVKDILVKQKWSDAEIKAALSSDAFTNAQKRSTVATQTDTASTWANVIATKALSAAKKAAGMVLGMVASAFLSMAATAIVSYIVNIIDELHTTTDEYREKLKETESELETVNSEIKNISSQIDELSSKNTPSLTDKEDLERLRNENKELEIRQKYLEMQKAEEEKDLSDKAKDEYNSKYSSTSRQEIDEVKNKFENPNSETQYVNGYLTEDFSNGENAIEAYEDSDDLATLIALYEHYSDKKKEAIQNRDAEAIEKYNEKLRNVSASLQEDRTELQGFKDDISKTGDSAELDSINQQIKLIDETLLSTGERLVGFLNDDISSSEKDLLVELANTGGLTEETLSKCFSSVDEYLKENGLTLEDLISILKVYNEELENTEKTANRFSKENMISELNGMSEGFEELDKIYESIKDDDPFDFKLLDDKNFKDTFSGLDGYADFFETVTSNADDIKACQSAFDNLVTEWIASEGILNNVTEENEKLTASMLKQMGVVNAEEVVKEALEIKENFDNVTEAFNKTKLALVSMDNASEVVEQLDNLGIQNAQEIVDGVIDTKEAYDELRDSYKGTKIAKEELANTSLEDSTDKTISALTLEDGKLNETEANIVSLWMETQIANGNHLTTDGNIANLQAMCDALGITISRIGDYGRAIKTLCWMEENKDMIGQDSFDSMNRYIDSLESNISAQFRAGVGKKPNTTNIKYGGGSSSNKDSGSSSDKDTEETFDWIETKISRLEREIENLGQTADASYKLWADRNSALANEMSKDTDEIKVQQQAYDYYMNKANSVGLSSTYQNLVKNGDIKIETLKDEKLIEKINSYTEWYEKALDCKDAIQDLNDELANLARQKFDNISSEFENLMSVVEHELNMLDSYVSQTEERGRFVSTKYYSSMIALEKQNIALLESEYAKLNASLNEAVNSGQIQKYSEEWYNMAGEINSVSEELVEANTSIIEFQNSIRDLEWEVFDKLQEFISQIQGESEFLQELMSDEKMFSDEGSITEHGRATLGLHAVNYETYMRQASDYAEELKKINKEIAEDPNNLTLLERRQELLEAQRDMISSAEDEKQAMKDLISEGYDTFLNYMQELIDKRKEAMQSIKDLYDYEKNVSEQTDEIARLQKIIDSYGGDNSEETKAKLQEYTVQLQDAKEALEETEYERYLSDQEEMLDTIVSETEEWINARLDNLDGLVQGVIDGTNENAESIRETLESETEKVGMTLTDEMNNIWSTEGSAGKIVAMYGDGFNSHLTTISSTLSGIKDYIYSMVKESDKEATSDIDKVQNGNVANPTTSSENNTKPNTSTTTTKPTTSTSSSTNSNSKWGSWFIKKKNYVSKSKLKKDSSIVDFNESTLNTLNCGKTLRA